jgi:hypothetical protein
MFKLGFRRQFDALSIIRRGAFGIALLVERCGSATIGQRPAGIDIYRAVESRNGFVVLPVGSQLIASLHVQRGDHDSIEAHGVVHIGDRSLALADSLIGYCPAEMRLHQIGLALNGLAEIAYRGQVLTLGVVSQALSRYSPAISGWTRTAASKSAMARSYSPLSRNPVALLASALKSAGFD